MTLAVIGMTGVERYAVMLHDRLARRPDIDVRSFAVGRGHQGERLGIRRRYRVPVRTVHGLWRTVHHPRAEWLAGGADVVHGLGGLPPPTRRPLVLTVHDLLPLTDPQFFTNRVRDEARNLARALDRASIVLTTCDATAAEIAHVTGIERERIAIAPLGPRDREAVAVAGGDPYILAIGAVTPRKGLDTLAAAVAELGPSCPPVLVAGPDGYFSDDVHAAVERHDVHHRFRFLGAVDDERLDELLASATIVCHPSRAEGFGIVCLEAMARGIPVVASDLPSIREVGGHGVALVPPDEPASLAAQISRLLADDGARQQLAQTGRAQASAYSWDRFADDVVRAYERALETVSSR